MILFSVFVLGGAVALYSAAFFEAPVSNPIRAALAVCRIVFLVAILYLLLKPEIQETDTETLRPTLYIALDDSQSMSYAIDPNREESLENSSRWNAISQALLSDGIVDGWEQKDYQLRFGLFSELNAGGVESSWKRSFPDAEEAKHASTNLAGVFDAFQKDSMPEESSYLLLFTDGQWNQGGDPLSSVQNLYREDEAGDAKIDHRVYAFGIGALAPVFDLAINAFQIPSAIRAGERAKAAVEIVARGDASPGEVNLRLIGRKPDGAELFSFERQVSILQGGQAKAEFELPALDKGEYEWVARFDPIEGEAFENNNQAVRGMRVRESRDPVLLLTTAPNWDFKFLKRVLEDHPSIEPYSYLLHENGLAALGDRGWNKDVSSNEIEEERFAIPVYQTVEDLQANLDQWSVIVLFDVFFHAKHEALAKAIEKYVQDGGGVIKIPGLLNCSPYPASIQSALPAPLGKPFARVTQSAIAQNGSVLLSEASQDQQENLPPLIPLFMPVDQGGLSGIPLMKANAPGNQSISLIEWFRYGLGRVVVCHAQSFWRWELLAGKNVLPTFWLSMIYHAKPDVLATAGELITDGFVYEIGQPVNFTYAVRERISDATVAGISVKIETPTRSDRLWLQPSPTSKGTFQGAYTPVQSGDFTAHAEGRDASAAFRVESRFQEINLLQQNIGLLQEIARQAGGGYANAPAWKELARQIPLSTQSISKTHSLFLGEKWWMVALLILFLGLEWFIRWRQGLP